MERGTERYGTVRNGMERVTYLTLNSSNNITLYCIMIILIVIVLGLLNQGPPYLRYNVVPLGQ